MRLERLRTRVINDAISRCAELSGGHLAAPAREQIREVLTFGIEVNEPPRPTFDPGVVHAVFALNFGRGGAHSIKPGNVSLNLASFLRAAASGTLTVAGGAALHPLLAVLAALLAWSQVRDSLKVPIQVRDAILLVALWRNVSRQGLVLNSQVRRFANAEISKDGLPRYSWLESRRCVRRLHRLGCIEKTDGYPAEWRLREVMRYEFS